MNIKLGRRTAAFIATGALALTGAGTALAGDSSEYSGSAIDGQGGESGVVSFDVDRVDGKRVVRNIEVGADTACRGGETEPVIYGVGAGRLTVTRDGKFGGERKLTNPFSSDATLTIDGKVVSPDLVRGTFRVKESRGGGIRCNTGELKFRASKVQ